MERPLLKKPKLEESVDGNGSGRERGTGGGDVENNNEEEEVDEQEEALIALIAHRSNEVEHNKPRASYYKSQVEVSERKLKESQSQLARFRSRRKSVSSSSQSIPINNNNNNINSSNSNGVVEAKADSPSRHRLQSHSRHQLVIPALNPKTTQQQQGSQGRNIFSKPSSAITATGGNSSRPNSSSSTPPNIAVEKTPKLERPSPVRSHEKKQPKKRMFEQREHQELITSIRSNVSPNLITFQSGNHICSQHKRKLRCLALSPSNDQIFVTSALDGVVYLWQVHSKGIHL